MNFKKLAVLNLEVPDGYSSKRMGDLLRELDEYHSKGEGVEGYRPFAVLHSIGGICIITDRKHAEHLKKTLSEYVSRNLRKTNREDLEKMYGLAEKMLEAASDGKYDLVLEIKNQSGLGNFAYYLEEEEGLNRNGIGHLLNDFIGKCMDTARIMDACEKEIGFSDFKNTKEIYRECMEKAEGILAEIKNALKDCV